jgi:ABC-type glycerol-3-phosphate transport system substrate-binding protein
MKKTSFVIAILASALLAGACGKKTQPAAPTTPPAGSDGMAGSGEGTTPAAGSGSAAQ